MSPKVWRAARGRLRRPTPPKALECLSNLHFILQCQAAKRLRSMVLLGTTFWGPEGYDVARGVERERPGHGGAPGASRALRSRLSRPRRELGDEAGEHTAVLRAPLLPVARGLDAVQQVAERCRGGDTGNKHGLGACSEEDLDEFAIVSEDRGEKGRMPQVGRLIRVCAALQEIVGR